MKKITAVILICFLGLLSCTNSPESEKKITFPYIERLPDAGDWNRGKFDELPHYDPDSDAMWQVDLRAFDLSELDLSDSAYDLMFAAFDSKTVWPAADKMPADFDYRKIMELGKNPGLGIRKLHEAGITGKGAGIAIIDQTLLADHIEYRDQLKFYEEAEARMKTWDAAMHGAAVASIAVGKTVGVAPEADLYYIASAMCNTGGGWEGNDFACLADSVYRILEINRQLPEENKIRVISISVGWTPESKGYDEMTKAAERVKEEGILLVCSSIEEVHGFKFQAMGRDPYADPDNFESYEPGMFWADRFFEVNTGSLKNDSDYLLVPMDSRTTASPGGTKDYVFYREGGWSWSIPYIAGMYALAVQADPEITPEKFWELALETGRIIKLMHNGEEFSFGRILDPAALISKLNPGVL